MELGADATEAEIKAAYHLLVKVWHPDRFEGDVSLKIAAEAKLKGVNSAYAFLTSNAGRGIGWRRPEAGSKSARTQGTAPVSSAWIAPALKISFRFFLAAVALLMVRYLWIAIDVQDSTSDEVQKVVGYGKDSLRKGLEAPKRRFLAAVEQDLERLNLWSPAPAPAVSQKIDALAAAAHARGERATSMPAAGGALQSAKRQPVTRKVYPYITVGSTRDEVLDQMGTPTASTDSKMVYGQSELYLKDNTVVGWKIDPFSSPIRVKLWPESSVDPSLDYFTLGSSRDAVLVVQGTPTGFTEDKFEYGGSEVYFQNHRVVRWKSDPGSIPLRARMP